MGSKSYFIAVGREISCKIVARTSESTGIRYQIETEIYERGNEKKKIEK